MNQRQWAVLKVILIGCTGVISGKIGSIPRLCIWWELKQPNEERKKEGEGVWSRHPHHPKTTYHQQALLSCPAEGAKRIVWMCLFRCVCMRERSFRFERAPNASCSSHLGLQTRACTYVHIYKHAARHTHTHTFTHKHAHIQTHVRTHSQTRHTHAQLHAYARTHTRAEREREGEGGYSCKSAKNVAGRDYTGSGR